MMAKTRRETARKAAEPTPHCEQCGCITTTKTFYVYGHDAKLCLECYEEPKVWFTIAVETDKGNTRGYVFGRSDIPEFWAVPKVGNRTYDGGIYDNLAEAKTAVQACVGVFNRPRREKDANGRNYFVRGEFEPAPYAPVKVNGIAARATSRAPRSPKPVHRSVRYWAQYRKDTLWMAEMYGSIKNTPEFVWWPWREWYEYQ